jgi:micrococcal nuclease
MIFVAILIATTACSEPTNVEIKDNVSIVEQSSVKLISATVDSVVDGDTIKITMGSNQETVRLLLVDTPETVHPSKPVEPYGPEASAFVKGLLIPGTEVGIEIDVSERDKYGRLLAYVWIDDNQMLNEMLLEQGLARVAYVYPPNVKYVDAFRSIQKEAQQASLGIWSIENYAATETTTSAYNSCKEAREAGITPIFKGDPGYSSKLDRDGDGVACE